MRYLLQMFHRKVSNTKIRILFLITIPLIIISIFMIIFTGYNIASEINALKKSYNISLKHFSEKSENEINKCIKFTQAFENNSIILPALMCDYTISDLTDIQVSLKNATETFDTIDSICIIDRTNKMVIGQGKYSPISEYFSETYNYSSYDYDYWNSFKFLDSAPYRIMSPSIVTVEGETKNIIPVVFRQLNGTKINSYLIVNLSLDSLLAGYNSDKYTENTIFYVLNNYTGQIFSTIPGDSGKYINNTPLYQSLLSETASFKYTSDDGILSIICRYSATDSLLGYTYFAKTPYMDIIMMQLPNTLFSLLAVGIIMMLAYILALKNSNKILHPLEQIAKTFNGDKTIDYEGTDFFEYLQTSAKYLVKNNSKLSNILPYAQEKYLINYLNSTDYTIDNPTKEIISASLPFKHNFFCSVIIQLYPTNLLYDSYTNAEYINIQNGFYNIVKEYFIAKFDTFIVSSEKETLYIIINTDNQNPLEEINSILNKIKVCLNNDSEYVELFIGLGETHEGLSGLKESHNEALNSLQITPKSKPNILFSIDKTIKYIFSNNDEANLLNALITNNTKKAMEIINYSVQKNENIDNRSLKQLYSQILNTILKAIRIKKIPFSEQGKYDFEICYELLSKSVDKIYQHILSLLDLFNVQDTKETITKDIVSYINDNYSDSMLSLESIAQVFNINSSYLSVLLKNTLSIGFHDYLNNLRITEAKRLLTQTDKPIQDIFHDVGFNNKQTFIRSFKNVTHITPSEYRKNKHAR